MKLFFSILFFASSAFAYETACSPDDLQKLLKASGDMLGIQAHAQMQATKFILSKENLDKKVSEISKEYRKINHDHNERILALYEKEIAPIVKSHPECDPNKTFTLEEMKKDKDEAK